jgi:hypothetical protein
MRCEPLGVAASRPCTLKVVHVFHDNCKARQWTGTSTPNQFRDVVWNESAGFVCDGQNKILCAERESFGPLLIMSQDADQQISASTLARDAAMTALSLAKVCSGFQLEPTGPSVAMVKLVCPLAD